MDKIRLGISACLLGERVRYDGQHKLDRYIVGTLGIFFDWVPICPEVGCGMSVPRESMRLVKTAGGIRLMTGKSGKDMTPMMETWAKKRLDKLSGEGICGFIFKKDSPSSGMSRVKVYTEAGMPVGSASGIFAGMLMDKFPFLPVEEEGRLHDPVLRENFIERVFVYHRWKEMSAAGPSSRALSDFHAAHKYLIMAHSPKHLKELGRIAAGNTGGKSAVGKAYEDYFMLLAEALRLTATSRKNTNVLMHLLGYFKKQLTADEKQELIEQINLYFSGLTPLVVPLTLINHYIRKYDQPYLKGQLYISPHPVELMLRNHT